MLELFTRLREIVHIFYPFIIKGYDKDTDGHWSLLLLVSGGPVFSN